MLTLFEAPLAAGLSARMGHLKFNFRTLAAIVVLMAPIAGCLPQNLPLAGADPADPRAEVAHARYTSTIAPYTPLRPSVPSPDAWRRRDDGVAPLSRPER